MKRFFIVAIILFSAVAHGQQYPKLSPEELRQDADSMYLQLQLNHADLYANWPKTEADAAFQQLRSGIREPMDRLAFTNIISPFLARFRDGHTYMDVDFENEDLKNYVSSGGKFFPLGVIIIDGKLIVSNTGFAETKLKRGDEILAINNVPAAAIIDKAANLWSADGKENAIATAQRLFSYTLWVAYNWGNRFEIDAKRETINLKESVDGIPEEYFLNLTFNAGGTVRQLHIYSEYSLAVVEINSYGNLAKTNAFIDSCFKEIKNHDIQNVALDLRKNGGGNSYIGDYFLAHINKKPYNTIRSKTWRVGPLVQSLPEKSMIATAVNRDKKTYTQKGEYLVSQDFDPQLPVTLNDSSVFTDVKFYLLTSARTYSSAHMTALAVKCGALGVIIGQPTGERLDLTGEIVTYRMPNSKLGVVIPTASYKAACGNGRQVGVEPDIRVPISVDDVIAGRDTELEVLKKLITEGKN